MNGKQIVSEWWKTQDQLIPTTRLQQPLIDEIDAAIAAAVQAEREAIKLAVSDMRGDMDYADAAHGYSMAINDVLKVIAKRNKYGSDEYDKQAAAIRARSNGEGRE